VDNGGCFFSDNALGVGFLLVGYGGQMRQQTPPAGVEFHAAKAAAFHDCRILPTMPSAASSPMSKRPHGKDSSCSLANLPIHSPLTLKVAAACSLQSKRETGSIPSSQSRPFVYNRSAARWSARQRLRDGKLHEKKFKWKPLFSRSGGKLLFSAGGGNSERAGTRIIRDQGRLVLICNQ
jgi:hypothetical protein